VPPCECIEPEIRHTTSAQPTRIFKFHLRVRESPTVGMSVVPFHPSCGLPDGNDGLVTFWLACVQQQSGQSTCTTSRLFVQVIAPDKPDSTRILRRMRVSHSDESVQCPENPRYGQTGFGVLEFRITRHSYAGPWIALAVPEHLGRDSICAMKLVAIYARQPASKP